MSQPNVDALFRPFRIKSMELRNRIVMAPMTRTFSPEGVPGENFSPEGVPGENVAAYYRRRAEGEVGLILSEGTVVDRPASRNDPGMPYFHSSPSLAGWKRVIDEVHASGGKMGPQIWHVGAAPNPRTKWVPSTPAESPSGLAAPGQPYGEAMSESAIADTIAAFARAAADAKQLGFDVVEIHGAHGYLIDQFFWSGTNLRTDEFGGATLKERSRFAVEVIKAIRQAVGTDFPVILRLSQWKQQDHTVKLATTPDEMADWLIPMREAGVDVFHCSQRRFWEPEFPDIDGAEGLNFAGWAKKLTAATTIAVGSVGLSNDSRATFAGEGSAPAGLDKLVQRIERDEFDLIAVGRALLGDPQWAKKIRQHDAADLTGFSPALLGQLV